MNSLVKVEAGPQTEIGIRRVLYVGQAADEICHFVTQHVGEIDITYESRTSIALTQIRAGKYDTVFVDLRNDDPSTKLLLPLVAAERQTIKLVVISSFNAVGQYLGVPGVARVLAAPVREGQFLRILGLKPKAKHYVAQASEGAGQVTPAHKPAEAHVSSAKPVSLIQHLSNKGMVIISLLYKRAAFVLLSTLFAAFLFYGFLIAFFLLSSSWGAPMSLTRGHELVNKAEIELTDLKIAHSQLLQRLTEAKLNKTRAERDFMDGRVMVKYAADTIKKERSNSGRMNTTMAKKIDRLQRVKTALEEQLSSGGLGDQLDKLYKKRLITKKAFTSSALGLVEASQRLASIESELDALELQNENSASTEALLSSLQAALETGKPITNITAASSDLLLLTKQAVEAKTTLDGAKERLEASAELIQELSESKAVLKRQLEALKQSVLVRAIDERIDVIYVPYSNRNSFQPGTPVYSCYFTIFFCEKAGTVGVALPGEVASVHPFFGKPIRGSFVEAKLNSDKAATREIIHGTRAPFFF